jgi:D-alanyl-D-alanine carboxypeptidase
MKMPKIMSLLKNHKLRMLLFLVFLLFLFLIPATNTYFYKPQTLEGYAITHEAVLPTAPPVPVKSGRIDVPNLSAAGILVKDITSGVVLYAKNENAKLAPASTSKVMTAIVSLNHYKLDDILTVNTVITEGKVMGLVSGEKMTMENLLYGALVDSANDAAYALAENYPGGVSKFVTEMNRVALELGLTNTHFENPIGFDNEGQYTTAVELAKQAIVGLQNPEFTKIVGTKSITVADEDFQHFHELKNVNELLGKVPGVSGVKTGFTNEGGEILVSEVKKNGHRVLIVILKSEDRFGETQSLMKWVFDNFEWKSVSPTTELSQAAQN